MISATDNCRYSRTRYSNFSCSRCADLLVRKKVKTNFFKVKAYAN